MKPEDQVISLDLARKLNELHFYKESLFYWIQSPNPQGKWKIAMHGGFSFTYHHEHLSAFTVSELMSILPPMIDTGKDIPFNNFRFNMFIFNSVNTDSLSITRQYALNYECDTHTKDDLYLVPRRLFQHNIHDGNVAECCAKVLIKLIEDGYMNI